MRACVRIIHNYTITQYLADRSRSHSQTIQYHQRHHKHWRESHEQAESVSPHGVVVAVVVPQRSEFDDCKEQRALNNNTQPLQGEAADGSSVQAKVSAGCSFPAFSLTATWPDFVFTHCRNARSKELPTVLHVRQGPVANHVRHCAVVTISSW